jgi:integrase
VGVAFWDFKHGQTGVAPNAIELHPILGKAISDRVGHARASMTLDVYSHVMPLDEVPAEKLLSLLASAGR